MTEVVGTDLEAFATGEVLEVLTKGSDDAFVELLGQLEVDEIADVGLVLTRLSKGSSIRAGRAAYQIRVSTPDGEWGREVYKLATLWEVSERTIQRWMAAAQEHFGFELTAAQKNAQVAAPPGGASPGKTAQDDWPDEDELLRDAGFTEEQIDGQGGYFGWDPEQGKDVWIPDEDSEDDEAINNKIAFENLIGQPWAERDSVTPSPQYENEMPGPARQAVAPILEPDDVWVAFTVSQIQAEHPAFGEQAAERSAKARWQRKLDEAPLDLLEELEMIHGSVPDDVIAKLHEAEEHKPIRPDEVTEGGEKKKSKRGPAAPKSIPVAAEKLMEASRDLHQRIHVGKREGTVPDSEIAAAFDSIDGAFRTIEGLKKATREAREAMKRAETAAGEPGDF